jgi:serine/threonine-protein kinase RsbW
MAASSSEAGAPPRTPLFLWALDPALAERYLAEIAPAPGRLLPLPAPADWPTRLPAPPFGVLIVAGSEEPLPAPGELAALRAAGGRLVLLLPACDERSWRRLLRRGFHEVLAPPLAGLDLELLFADAERGLPLDRRLPDFERRVHSRVDFRLPAELRFVAPAAAFLCRLAREHGFHPRVWAEALPLALDEALVNAIRHGCQLDPDKEVRVSARFGPRRLRVRIEDPGAGFDPERVVDPMSARGLRQGGGRGVLLIKELVDRVDYKEGGRVVQLTLRRRID